jgi:hypothetical protein
VIAEMWTGNVLLLFACCGVHAVPAQEMPGNEGIVLQMTQTTPGAFDGKPFTMKITAYFSGNTTKHIIEGGSEIINHLDQGKIVIVDHSRKSYSEMTPDQLQKVLDQGAAEFGASEESQAARKAGSPKRGLITTTRQGDGGIVAGYKTEKYLIKGPVELQIWVAPELEVPDGYYDSLKLTMPHNPLLDMNKIYDELAKIKGVAMKRIWTLKTKDKTMTTTTVVISVEKRPLPASVFEVPPDYKPVEPPF